ncbi:MAG: hypothetical protein L0Z53_03925 [Acidobacteriales bacterium]|nr:hypothetical protein [Terriglobales bacterium]
MPRPLLAIWWGGLGCGVFDITQACIAWGIQNGVPPIRIFQSVAAGVLGRAAFQGGWPTAALGLGLHFFISFSAAAVYYLASRKIKFLTEHAVIAGLLYGEAVFWFMRHVVIPLSATSAGPFSMATLLTGPIGHMFLVGLPISLAVRKYSK